MTQILRLAARRLRRSRGMTVVCTLVLALGIGANVAIYSLVDAIVLEPLPYPDASRLTTLWHRGPGLGIDKFEQADATYLHYRERARTLEEVGVYELNEANLTGEPGATRIGAAYVTASLLDVLGAPIEHGRTLGADDERPDSEPTVLLGHRLWRDRFGADPGVVGRTLRINGQERTVVGVLAASFEHPRGDAELWMPLVFDPAEAAMDNFSYLAIARIAPGATPAEVERELAGLLPEVPERFPGVVDREMLERGGVEPFVVSLRDDVVGDLDRTLWLILAGVGLVLLIACVNVANLFLVRAEGRRREVAVRSALGATRRALLADAIAESAVLALLAGAAGLAIGAAGITVLRTTAQLDLPRFDAVEVDASVLTFAAGVSLFSALLFGLLPALRSGARRPSAELREGGRGGSASGRRLRARNALVVVQIALAMVLLVGAGLLLRSFQQIRAVDPGFDPGRGDAGALLFRLSLTGGRYDRAAERVRTFHEVGRRISALPGVEAVGFSSARPFFDGNQNGIQVEDRPSEQGLPWVHPMRVVVGDYFAALRLPLLAGETFRADESLDDRAVAVVSESFAERFWGEPARALGRRIRSGIEGQGEPSPWATVIGVVADLHDEGLTRAPSATVYFPFQTAGDLAYPSTLTAAVRVSSPPHDLLPAVRSVLGELDPELPISGATTLRELLRAETVRAELSALLLALAAAGALAIGSVGLFGVLSYLVALRRHELGIRTALGAARGDLAALVLRHAAILVALGLVTGALATLALSRALASLLFGVSPFDPVTLGLVSALLAVTGLAAAALPTWRATAADPMTALRSE
ncbi:MAG TPA: ABC transporter permease [Thermoanaerobaculia bacterium]|nr:ABC transporter permease [Thermoanaerobaculia bacterium]